RPNGHARPRARPNGGERGLEVQIRLVDQSRRIRRTQPVLCGIALDEPTEVVDEAPQIFFIRRNGAVSKRHHSSPWIKKVSMRGSNTARAWPSSGEATWHRPTS